MDRKRLPKKLNIAGVECDIFSDYRDILDIFEILNDPDLLNHEKIYLALNNFYTDQRYNVDIEAAVKEMFNFITMGEPDQNEAPHKPLFDWEQDFNIIITPINKTLGCDVRGVDYLHWWTFLGAFMEIGECTFNTYVGIRDKLNRGVRLEKHEERIYKEHRDKIIIKTRVDSTTQALMDEILGKG